MSEKKKILVADDAENVKMLLTTSLEMSGYDVTTAGDGVETYEKGKTGTFDLVIIDQLMPGLSGLEVIREWQEDSIGMPVIMLSGVDDDKTVVDSLNLGAVDFIRKPFRLPELLARVRQHI